MQNFRKHWLLLLWLLAVALGGAFSGVESGEACPFRDYPVDARERYC